MQPEQRSTDRPTHPHELLLWFLYHSCCLELSCYYRTTPPHPLQTHGCRTASSTKQLDVFIETLFFFNVLMVCFCSFYSSFPSSFIDEDPQKALEVNIRQLQSSLSFQEFNRGLFRLLLTHISASISTD